MFKNVTGQRHFFFAFDATTNLPKTGDAANLSGYWSADGSAATALNDTVFLELSATNAPGYYWVDLLQSETNGSEILFTGKSTTANVVVVGAPAVVNPKRPAIRKNAALANFHFMMTDSTTHAPATGKTVTVTRAIDNGAFAAGTLSAVTEIANGMYRVDFASGDLNGNVITLRATASGCDDRDVTLLTEEP